MGHFLTLSFLLPPRIRSNRLGIELRQPESHFFLSLPFHQTVLLSFFPWLLLPCPSPPPPPIYPRHPHLGINPIQSPEEEKKEKGGRKEGSLSLSAITKEKEGGSPAAAATAAATAAAAVAIDLQGEFQPRWRWIAKTFSPL